MGIALTGYGDAGCAHEGYAAHLLDGNSITGAHSDESEPRIIGQVVAACDRGWKGTIHDHTTTGPHAKPALRRLQREERDRLGQHLRALASHSAELTHDAYRDLTDQVLDDLALATELARQLRDAERELGAASGRPATSG